MIKFLWPFVIVICGIRAILMIVELQRGYVRPPLHAPHFLFHLEILRYASYLVRPNPPLAMFLNHPRGAHFVVDISSLFHEVSCPPCPHMLKSSSVVPSHGA